MDCLFCKIINGDIPSYTIYEDEYVKCFLDINPKLLIIKIIIQLSILKELFLSLLYQKYN